MLLKNLKSYHFFWDTVYSVEILCMQARVLISDFAVFTAIVIMVLVDFLVHLSTPKLKVPPQFRVNICYMY